MGNLIWGIFIVIGCVIGLIYSWQYYRKENYALALALLMICGFALRIYPASDLYLHPWDERYHALVAKHLIIHPLTPTLYDNPALPYDFTDWTANHIWVHKQPVPLWSMAASMSIFGTNEIALRLPSVLLTTLGILLIFYIGAYFFDKKAAYIAALLYAINGLIIEMAAGRVTTDHIDVFFMFFVELSLFFSVYFIQKNKPIYNILTGISLGAAILCKWLPALVVVPVWLFIVLDAKQYKPKEIFSQLCLLMASCLLVVLPWQLYIFTVFGEEARWEASFNMKHITEVLSGREGPWYYFLDRIRINYGDLIYLPLIWFGWKLYRSSKNFKLWALLLWMALPLIFFSAIKTKMPGYILFIAPALFIITGACYQYIAKYKQKLQRAWLYNIILILLIALPARYAIERIKPFNEVDRSPQWVQNLKLLENKTDQKVILFNHPHPIEAMFYTDFTVYSQMPDIYMVDDLMKKGYRIIINDNGNLPADIKKISSITIQKL